MQLIPQVFDSNMPPEFVTVVIVVLLDTQMRAEAVKHLNDLGRLAFGQQVDLQIEVISAIRDNTHSILLHKNDSCDQNRLQ
jgi:adenylate kinase